MGIRCGTNLSATCRHLFTNLQRLTQPATALGPSNAPSARERIGGRLDRRVRSQYVDVCRFLLPAASLANVGMTANARVLENMIRKMLPHELVESPQKSARKSGQLPRLKVPTLVKYADAAQYLVETKKEMGESDNRESGIGSSSIGLVFIG